MLSVGVDVGRRQLCCLEAGTWSDAVATHLPCGWGKSCDLVNRAEKQWSLQPPSGREANWFISRSVVSNSLQLHGLQHARPPSPSPPPGVYPNSCPSSQWCHPTISPSVVPFSSCLQSFPASGSFPLSQLSASGGQSIGVSASASVLPMSIQDWCPLGWTGWISSQSKGLSRIFSNATVQKHQFFNTLWLYT